MRAGCPDVDRPLTRAAPSGLACHRGQAALPGPHRSPPSGWPGGPRAIAPEAPVPETDHGSCPPPPRCQPRPRPASPAALSHPRQDRAVGHAMDRQCPPDRLATLEASPATRHAHCISRHAGHWLQERHPRPCMPQRITRGWHRHHHEPATGDVTLRPPEGQPTRDAGGWM
jgi:hypothetical protein